MTAKKDLKPVISFDEMISLTDAGKKRGFRCEITFASSLMKLVDPERILDRMRTILDLTTEDADMERFRRVILHGERVASASIDRTEWFEDARRFLARARAGIGGLSVHGNILAFAVRDHMVLAHVGNWPRLHKEAPSLSFSAVSSLDELDNMSVVFVP